jgi:2-polyprenyl-3-methyl-5-hydroxy-6-metoxy-1,4-benzoquinol methylase
LTHLTHELLDFIERWLPPRPSRVLEIGCGDGALTRRLINAGFDAVGIDPHAPAGDGFQQVRVEQFRSAEPFDAAVAVRSLHHVADPRVAAQRTHALLGPGGRLVISEFVVEHLDDAARRWLEAQGLGGQLDYDYSDVLPISEVERALAAYFRPVLREPNAYLANELEREDLVASELRAIADGRLRPVGMRLVFERID